MHLQNFQNIIEKTLALYCAGENTQKFEALAKELKELLKNLPFTKPSSLAESVCLELARIARSDDLYLVPPCTDPYDPSHDNLSLDQLAEIVGTLHPETVKTWARSQKRDPNEVLQQLENNYDYIQTPQGFKPLALWLAGRPLNHVHEELREWPPHLLPGAHARLERVRPNKLPFEEAEIELSDSCVPPDIARKFFCSLAENAWYTYSIQINNGKIKLTKFAAQYFTAQWATPNCSAERLFNLALGKSTRPSANPEELELIEQKIAQLNQKFREFLDKNPLCKAIVEEEYQKTYGQFLNLPVSEAPLPFENEKFSLWPFQRRAARRVAAAQQTFVFHPTGAGKTRTALAAAALIKHRKHPAPARTLVIAPSNVLHQWAEEARNCRLRPVVIEQGTSPAATLAKIISCGADIVLLAHSTFANLPSALPLSTEATQLRLAKLNKTLSEYSKNGNNKRVKHLQRLIDETNCELLQLQRVNNELVRLDLLPFDLVVIDEAHLFKGYADPRRCSSGTLLATAVADRIAALKKTNPQLKVAALSATPVLNRPEELFALIEFLKPELLAETKISSPETFVQHFARTESCWETAPAGGWRARNRIIGWRRRSELCRLLAPILDTASYEEVAAYTTLPNFTHNELVTVDPGPLFELFCERLIKRVEMIEAGQVRNTDDNMLLVTTDARRAALHLHMVDPTAAPNDPQNAPKVEALARIAAQIKNLSQHGRGLQLIFCDLRFSNQSLAPQTQRPNLKQPNRKFDLYAYIKNRLVAHGFSPHEIAFVEAGNKKLLNEIKSKVAAGSLRIIIGSTQSLGTGLNFQKRLVAIHHLDAPWRPADVDQRLGRMVRTGNLWKHTRSFVYILRRSFDAYVWQILERKARTINELLSTTQVQSSQFEWREDLALTAAEARAAASGNPYTAAYLCILTEQERALRAVAFHSARAHAQKQTSFAYSLTNPAAVEQTKREIQSWKLKLTQVASLLDSYKNLPIAKLPEAFAANFAPNLHPFCPPPGQRLTLALFPVENGPVALVVENNLLNNGSFFLFVDQSANERIRFDLLPVRATTLARFILNDLLPRLDKRLTVLEETFKSLQLHHQQQKEAELAALQALARAAAASAVACSLAQQLVAQGFSQFPQPCEVNLPNDQPQIAPLLDQQRSELDALAQRIVLQWSTPQSQDIQLHPEDFVLVEQSNEQSLAPTAAAQQPSPLQKPSMLNTRPQNIPKQLTLF